MCAAYADDAVVEHYTDGIHERLAGIEEIRRGWQSIFDALPYFVLKKRLVAADDAVIANEWIGAVGRSERRHARGIEIWWFDSSGNVIEHRLYTFLNLRGATSTMGRLIFAATHPILGFRLERERRRWLRRTVA